MLYLFDEHYILTGTRSPQRRPNGDPILNVIGATPTQPGSHKLGHAQVWRGNHDEVWPYNHAQCDLAAQGADGAWWYIADHRQCLDNQGRVIEDTGTPYWLPADGDDWQTPARYMTDIGALPDGAVLTQPLKTRDDLATDLRSQRDTRIAATDYLMAADYPLDDAQRAAWAAYRQALRDMPQATGFPWDGGGKLTPWPVKSV